MGAPRLSMRPTNGEIANSATEYRTRNREVQFKGLRSNIKVVCCAAQSAGNCLA